ncbi:MAG: hypothetical protein K0S74_1090 [Chlamydiales bacterium]|jgi:DNA-binding YbaB/EbfC family protein|nr:hypothetical protein [Chlamydiales bacterium]
MGKGFAKQKKQMRELQDQFAKMQDDLKTTQVTGTAANQLVSVTLNGESELISIKIKPECVDPQDVEGLEDLIKVAFQDANNKLKEQTSSQLPNMGNLGGLFGI